MSYNAKLCDFKVSKIYENLTGWWIFSIFIKYAFNHNVHLKHTQLVEKKSHSTTNHRRSEIYSGERQTISILLDWKSFNNPSERDLTIPPLTMSVKYE